MVYVLRNEAGKINALYDKFIPDSEKIDINHPEVVEFLTQCEGEKKYQFLQSDLQLIRVLEDLIEVLLNKNVINITDFPAPVINKLLARKGIRQQLSGAIGMEFNDEK